MKIISKENKIKRLRWQIEQIQEVIDRFKNGNKQFQEAIDRRERAIEYLSKCNADWVTLKKMFGFDYCVFNVNRKMCLFGPQRKVE